MFTLAKLYLKEEKYNLEKAVSMLEASCMNSDIQPYAAYSLAKILFEDNEYHNQERAIGLLESAADKNRWASYLLGKIYLYGTDEIERNKDLAVLWLTKSAQNGNEFAKLLFDPKALSELPGHTDAAITLNRYCHPSMQIKKDYVSRLCLTA